MSKFKLKLVGVGDDSGKLQTLEMEAYAKDAEELAARLDKEFKLSHDDKGWSMYIEWLSDDDSKLEDAWDKWTADGMPVCYQWRDPWSGEVKMIHGKEHHGDRLVPADYSRWSDLPVHLRYPEICMPQRFDDLLGQWVPITDDWPQSLTDDWLWA